MVRGIGTDIIEISRIRKSIERHSEHFLNSIFTRFEQEYCFRYKDSAPRFAGRFAGKEAIIKALGSGFSEGFTWLDIEIRNNSKGQPEVVLSPHMQELFNQPQILISISHCREYAMATAVLIES